MAFGPFEKRATWIHLRTKRRKFEHKLQNTIKTIDENA